MHGVIPPAAGTTPTQEGDQAERPVGMLGRPVGIGSRKLSDSPQASREIAALKLQLAALKKEVFVLSRRNAELTERLNHSLRNEAEARTSAYHDDLTGLPNRRLLKDRFKQAVAQAHRQRKEVALLLIDLDGFKGVNDGFGHTVGDQLLKAVAKRLVSVLRTTDTVCRYGGDEFIVVLPEVEGAEAANKAIDKIKACLSADHVIDGHRIAGQASVGYALYPEDGDTYPDLLRKADAAMYCTKAGRRR